MRIGIVTLGCDKNMVDTEYLAGILDQRGHQVVAEGIQSALDVLVIYTCGFIESARAQSVDVLEAYLEAKRTCRNPRRIVLVGCLTQRYGTELQAELPDVDAIAGVGRPEAVANLVEHIASTPADSPAPVSAILDTPSPSMAISRPLPRKRLDSSPSAYLKIADGCNHQCSFCAIPAMKGPYVSVPREILLAEACEMVHSGIREINLIAQDIGPYGRDLYPDYDLPHLLQDLCAIDGDYWIRLLYMYPAGITDSLLRTLANQPRICKYLDIPLQHLDPGILQAMRRPSGQENVVQRIAQLRDQIPDLVIRTTMIVGFPGETAPAYQNLLRGMREIQFDRLGAFAYSSEEGTPAAEFQQPVPSATAQRRLDRLMNVQAEISALLQQRMVGKTLRVLIESISKDGTEARGRSYREAPEVDGDIIIPLKKTKKTGSIVPGKFAEVRIVGADTYDLIGEMA